MVKGINCHSPYKHYMMFHGGCNDGGYGSIFNTTYNIECGGHGGFWGGFGFGLGNAFGSLFSGFLGGGWGNFGFGNMFSGGFGNMWGNMWGGGSPFATQWGGGAGGGNYWGDRTGRVGDSDRGCHCKDHETKTVEKVVDDADEPIHKGFKDKIAQLSDTDVDGAKKLYNEIKAKMDKNADEHNKSISTDAYENLLKDLQKKFPHVTFDSTKPAVETTPVVAEKVTIDGKETPVKDLTADDIAKLTPEQVGALTDNQLGVLTKAQIEALTPEQIKKLSPEQAKKLLGQLGLLRQDDDNKDGVKATTNYKALLLTQQSGLDLACGHNKALDNVAGADAYLNGKIDDVKLNGTTITFIIETENGKYKMSCEADSTKYQIAELVENKTKKYTNVKIGTEYEIIEDDDDDHAVRNGKAAIQ